MNENSKYYNERESLKEFSGEENSCNTFYEFTTDLKRTFQNLLYFWH